jgi:hypothetical protein
VLLITALDIYQVVSYTRIVNIQMALNYDTSTEALQYAHLSTLIPPFTKIYESVYGST